LGNASGGPLGGRRRKGKGQWKGEGDAQARTLPGVQKKPKRKKDLRKGLTRGIRRLSFLRPRPENPYRGYPETNGESHLGRNFGA